MEKKFITAEELPKEEKIYFKKDIFGYRIVHPIRNEDGSLNWWNLLFGGKRFAVTSGLALIVLLLLGLSYQHDMGAYKDVVENPCDYCEKRFVYVNETESDYFLDDINLSEFVSEGYG